MDVSQGVVCALAGSKKPILSGSSSLLKGLISDTEGTGGMEWRETASIATCSGAPMCHAGG